MVWWCGRGFINDLLYYLDVGEGGGRRMIGELEPGRWGSPDVVVMR